MIALAQLGKFRPPLVIAHRGLHSPGIRENTLRAFEAAIDGGADAIEFDLRCTKDRRLVVHHDPMVRGAGRIIARQTLDQVRRAGQRWGIDIPTLEETLQCCKGKIALDIELKRIGYESETLETVARYFAIENVVFTSFRISTVARIKELAPEAKAGLLLGKTPLTSVTRRYTLRAIVDRLQSCGADFVAPHKSIARPRFIRFLKGAGFPVVVWTVNNPKRAKRLADHRVDALVTDRPQLLLNSLRSQ
jgi:glycerophosphoryl diester phosphodiesterase